MKIGSIRHKGLSRFYERGDSSGLPQAHVTKIRKILAFLVAAHSHDETNVLTSWRAHQLGGNRRGTWSLHVSANWRMTFTVEGVPPIIADLNLEDYH